MNTVAMKVNAANLVKGLKFSFTNKTTFIGELMQNARRANATQVVFEFAPETKILRVTDDGCGIDSIETLLTVAESGWDADVVAQEHPSAMVDFLTGHCRYDTMSSWNRLTSYANNIKLHRLGLSSQQLDKAYEMLDTDFWEEIREPIDEFTHDQGNRYTIRSNGRSGGYLVLHESHLELTGHLSYCPNCGQRNFKKVPPVSYQDNNEEVIAREILRSQNSWLPGVYLGQSAIQALPISDDKKLTLINRLKSELRDCSLTDACGVCAKPRRNFSVPPSRLMVASKGIDQNEDFFAEDWSMEALRDRVELICAFDAACDSIRSNFIALLEDYDVVEVTEHRPVQVKTLVARAA